MKPLTESPIERTPEMLANKLVHTITYGYPNIKYIGKFTNPNAYIMTEVLKKPGYTEDILNKGDKGLQSVVNRIEKEWLGGRNVINNLSTPELTDFPQEIMEAINKLEVRKLPHITTVAVPGANFAHKVSIYQEQGRNASSYITINNPNGEIEIDVRNRFNAYGDEKYLFAFTWGVYRLSIVVAESSAGVKGAATALVYALDENNLYIDTLDKYMDTTSLTEGVH